jgi:hypothetical protein
LPTKIQYTAIFVIIDKLGIYRDFIAFAAGRKLLSQKFPPCGSSGEVTVLAILFLKYLSLNHMNLNHKNMQKY